MATLPKSGVICFLPSTIRAEEEAAEAAAREREDRGPQDGAEDMEGGDGASKGNGKPPPGADEELEAAVLQALVDLLARGLCHQVHREVRTGLLTMADIYNAPGRHGLAATAADDGQEDEEDEEDEYDDSVDIYGRVPPKEPRHSLACAACGRPVGVGRYAPHLDKCLGKGKAGRSGGSQRCKQSKEQRQRQQQQQLAGGGGGGNGAGGKAGGAGDGGTPSKKARKKKDQNKHPLLSTYVFPDAAAAPAAMAVAMAEARAAPVVVRLKLEKGAAVRALPPADWPVAAPVVGASSLLPPTPTAAAPNGQPRPPAPHQHQQPPQRILPREQAPSPPPLLPHPRGPPVRPNGGIGMVVGAPQPRPSTSTQMGQQMVPVHMLPGPNGAGVFVPAAVHAGGQPMMMQQPYQQQGGGLMFGGEGGGVGCAGLIPMQPMPVQGQPVMLMAGAPRAGGQQQQQQFFAPPPQPYGPVGQLPPPPPHGYGYQNQYQQHQQPPSPQGFGGPPPMPPPPQS